jgi:hypothetical protein
MIMAIVRLPYSLSFELTVASARVAIHGECARQQDGYVSPHKDGPVELALARSAGYVSFAHVRATNSSTENIRRFYANSMLDADKQAAINLFLGVDSFVPIGPQLPRHYQQWFNPNHLRNDEVEQALLVPAQNVFREYYKPHILSQFQRLYAL